MHTELSILGILASGPFTDPGAEQNLNPFGPGSAWGFRVSGEAEFRPVSWLTLSIGGMVEDNSFSFDGQGCAQANTHMVGCYRGMSTNAALPSPIQNAQDLYLGLWLLAGYRF
jgi:hypothetical protein